MEDFITTFFKLVALLNAKDSDPMGDIYEKFLEICKDEESLSKLFNDIKQKAQDIFMNILTNTKKFNSQSIEKQLINSLNQYLYQRTERKPLLISSINILN